MTEKAISGGVHPRPLVPYRLSICGLGELPEFAGAGVSHIVSIVDPAWPEPRCFADYGRHERYTFHFHDEIVPSVGIELPEPQDIKRLLEVGRHLASARVEHLLVHCHIGQSRSTAAAAILLAQHNPGREDEAFAQVAAVRPRAWPNGLMIRMADRMLGRGGRFVQALRGHYGHVARRFPEMVDLLRDAGRGDEAPV